MNKYHYYADGVNIDLVYQLPMYFDVGVEMSTTTFDQMFGRPTLGKASRIRLDRIDDEDIFHMKRYGLNPRRIPYPNILSDKIKNNQYEIKDDDYFAVS